ncbi:hypothetical protein [Streptomyces sp. NPDC051173]|uniref:hypothetical protein n=1 Tax=Streptomyces sp. NPDC051173 TaxID=3155164 RepID=UPI00344D4BED
MNDEGPRCHLMTREQGTRLFLASHDLEEARAADLAELDVMSLIVLVERLRGSLDDIIRLVAELTAQ